MAPFIPALGRLVRLAAASLPALLLPPYFPRQIVLAIRAVAGPQSVGPVVVMMAAIGSIAALQGVGVLRLFGAEDLLAGMIAQSTIRDLAPTMTALMIAGQVGTAIAGEIGAMKVGEEIDALRVIAVDPVRYLVAPRLIAMALVTPLLTGIGAASALAAAYVTAVVLHGAGGGAFLASLATQISPGPILEACAKGAVFGLIIALLACFHGLEAQGGAEGVGKAANNAIVQSILLVAAAETVLTSLLLRAGL